MPCCPQHRSPDPHSLPRCVMGNLTVEGQGRQAPLQKSRVVGPGAPGARGDLAAGHVGPGGRAGAAAAPHSASWCYSTARGLSTNLRPASQQPAQWTVNGAPGPPGLCALSHAGAP